MCYVEELLEFGADPNVPDKDYFTALGIAIREKHLKVALALANHESVEINVLAGNLGSPLHIAVVYH